MKANAKENSKQKVPYQMAKLKTKTKPRMDNNCEILDLVETFT